MVTWVYTLTMGLALTACTLLLRWFQRDLSLTARQKIMLGFAAFIGAMLGAKFPFFLYQVFQVNLAPDPHGGWIATWFSNGKTIMFGIVGGYLAVELAKAILKIRARTGDSFVVPVAVGVAIGRLACLSAGCCYGVVTEVPWGIPFALVDEDPSLKRHPTQIYEFLFHLSAASIFFLMFWRLHWRPMRKPDWFETLFWGNLLKVYLVAYLVYRFLTEEIRPEPEIAAGWTVYQLTALTLLPVFITLWAYDVVNRIQRLKRSAA